MRNRLAGFTALLTLLFIGSILAIASAAHAAPDAKPWSRWEAHDASNPSTIDHQRWARFLTTYLRQSPDGVYLLAYGKVTAMDRALLRSYLSRLEHTAISEYSRAEQKAFWINLYNALTIQVILDHYPVDSITDIDISPGLVSNGPWDAKLTKVEGGELSLNDIEHRILRPVWGDPRIHYSVNCASIGCPNLQPEPFTAANTEDLLEDGAEEFVNHPRGARFEGNRLVVSQIYLWYLVDFGNSEAGLIEHLQEYAVDDLADRLEGFDGKIEGDYDWRLNELR